MDYFLYDNDLRHERVRDISKSTLLNIQQRQIKTIGRFYAFIPLQMEEWFNH